jgi:short-subunit dehydrogenase
MGIRRLIKNYTYRKKFEIKEKEVKDNLEKQSILVTGANSGIGLALTKKLLDSKNSVSATYNQNKDNLAKIKEKDLEIFQCDQSKIENVDNLKNLIKDKPINVIINNAGIWGGQNQNFNNIDYENFTATLNVNAISIIKICEIVINYSKKDSLNLVVNISSLYSSTENNTTGTNYIYKGTKSLMNSFSKNLSIDLKNKYGINVFSVDPGQVKTKMNPYGLLATDQVALKIINLLKFGNELHGKFIDLNKNILSW